MINNFFKTQIEQIIFLFILQKALSFFVLQNSIILFIICSFLKLLSVLIFFPKGPIYFLCEVFLLFLYCNSFCVAYSAAGCINPVMFFLTARREASRKMEKTQKWEGKFVQVFLRPYLHILLTKEITFSEIKYPTHH